MKCGKKESIDISGQYPISSSSTTVKSVKIIRDQAGNIVNEEVASIEAIDPKTSSNILSLPKSITTKQTSQSNNEGKLIFTLHSANNLENKDWVGKSDPYGVISLGQLVYKTKTISNSLNPDFNEEIVFELNELSPSNLIIELFDEDITRDDCLGVASIDVLPIKRQLKQKRQTILLTNCKSGEITYSVEFVPVVKDVFSEASSEGESKHQNSKDTKKEKSEEKSELLLRLSDLGIENIEVIDQGNTDIKQEDLLLKDVINLQASTKQKISGLMKTIQQVECGTHSRNEHDPQIVTIKTLKILDKDGNIVEERQTQESSESPNSFSDSTQTVQKSSAVIPQTTPTSYIITKELSSDLSPTSEDILFSEYPHLTKPMDLSNISSNISKTSHSVKYFHSSNEPFQNITSLRAHFVLAFDAEVPEVKETESKLAVKNIKFDEAFNNSSGESNFSISRTVSSSSQIFSTSHSFSGSEFDSFKESVNNASTSDKEDLKLLASGEASLDDLNSSSSVSSWMQPVISGSSIYAKDFSKNNKDTSDVIPQTQTHAFFSQSFHSPSSDHSVSGPTISRYPISTLSKEPTTLFQSLPPSPMKKTSTKTMITSEQFSSDKDISRSLDLVYNQPDGNQKEKLSSIYKSMTPNTSDFYKNKPSFTHFNRQTADEAFPKSPSPEWKLRIGDDIDFTPCDQNKNYSCKVIPKSQFTLKSQSHPKEFNSPDNTCSNVPPCGQLFEPKSPSSVCSPKRKFQYVQGSEEQYSVNVQEVTETFKNEAFHLQIDDKKVTYKHEEPKKGSPVVERFSVNSLISKFENKASAEMPA